MFLTNYSRDNIASNILNQRLKWKMNKKEFSAYIEMDYQNYRKMENGDYTPGLEKLTQICDILDITPNELLLEKRTLEDYAQETYDKFARKITDMIENMKIIENFRVEAELAKKVGNDGLQKDQLTEVIYLCTKTNEKYMDIIHYLALKNYKALKPETIRSIEALEQYNRTNLRLEMKNLLPQIACSVDDYWEISTYVYRRYISDYIAEYSELMFQDLLEKAEKQ